VSARDRTASPGLAAILTAGLLLSSAGQATGQRAPGFGGLEVRAGLTFPEGAEIGAGVMGEVDLGYVLTPALRTFAGLSHFGANIDREPGDDEGSYTATGGWLGARYDVLRIGPITPYVRTALTIQRVRADAFDRELGALLEGGYFGAALGLGLAYGIDLANRFQATAELRRTFMNNIANTAIEVGLRYQRLGTRAYLAADAPISPRRPARRDRPEHPPEPEVAEPAITAEPPAIAADTAAPPVDREPVPESPTAADAEAAASLASATRAASRAAEAMLRQGLARATAVMQTAGELRESPTGFVVTLGGGAFASGAATLSSEARTELRVLATVLAGYPGHIVTVEGHTDSVGEPAANQRLSEDRAAAVRAALIVEGVDPLWTAARGWGQRRPVASNETPAGRAQNRRVEIHIDRIACPALPLPGPEGGLVCQP
jgi:outer membrane protein OmpA-like peptidoglycan-associated protein